ncbi:MAG: hypothetical protein GY705_12460 [Bacteroidetes bacterium]|nr:hypothetical protein [Bacteroidota bacterium]
MKRQIFGDTSGQDPNLHLALCHTNIDLMSNVKTETLLDSVGKLFGESFEVRLRAGVQVSRPAEGLTLLRWKTPIDEPVPVNLGRGVRWRRLLNEEVK